MTHVEMLAMASCICFARVMPKWMVLSVGVIAFVASSYLSTRV